METKNSMFISALKSGLIIGVVSIVVFLISYVADFKPVGILMPILYGISSFAILVIILVYLFKNYRTQIGGYISFRNAFLYCFIAFAAGSILSSLFSALFIQFIEPEYYKNIMEAQKVYMENYLSGKMSDEQITEQLDKIDEQAATMGSFSGMLKTLAGSILIGGIVGLIIGAIMKKNPEMFDTTAGGAI